MVQNTSVAARNDERGRRPISEKQRWLEDNRDKYVVRSKEKDWAALYEEGNKIYFCEMEVSVNCLEMILIGLVGDGLSKDGQEAIPRGQPVYLKKIIAALVENVASHAVIAENSLFDVNVRDDEIADSKENDNLLVVEEGEPVAITEDSELRFVHPSKGEEQASGQTTIRLISSPLKRTVKRKKAMPRYPVYMWVLGSPEKRIIPPRHATDFYYRLLEGKAGYPSNYLGACINDLVAQGIVDVGGKKLTLTDEGADLMERSFDDMKSKDGVYWTVRIGHRKSR